MKFHVKVYGISAPDDYYDLTLDEYEWKHLRDEYEKGDNRVVGIVDTRKRMIYFQTKYVTSICTEPMPYEA